MGRSRPSEGNPQAPSSFAPGPGGALVVLDQVNGRMVRFGPGGEVVGSTPVTQQAPQDLAVGKNGTAAVLDRLGDKSVSLFGPDGSPRGELPVVGRGIPEGGAVTGVFVDGDDVYVEREHSALVRIGDAEGHPDPDRPEVPGRPSRDGSLFLSAGIVDMAAGRAYVNAIERPSLQHRFTRELRLGSPLAALVLLDSDLRGTIYLGSQLEPIAGQPALVRLVCLSPTDGSPIGTADVVANTGPEETLRDFAVLDEGGVLFSERSEQGVQYRRVDCR